MPLDWDRSDEFHGIVRLYRDLIRLRRNRSGATRGLLGRHVRIHRIDEDKKLIAYHRWDAGGRGDDVVVVMNFHHRARDHYRIGFPRGGLWKLRLNTDWTGYSDDFGDFDSFDIDAHRGEYDGLGFSGVVAVAPYSALIYSQDR